MPPPPAAQDTTPLIRLIATVSVVTVAVTILALVGLRGGASRGPGPAATPGPTLGPTPGPDGGQAAVARSRSVPPPVAPATTPASPRWIWTSAEPSDGEQAHLRRHIEPAGTPSRVTLRFSCDNEARVFLGADLVAESTRWEEPVVVELPVGPFAEGVDLTVHARNREGPAGLLVVIEIETTGAHRRRIVSDASWIADDEASFSTPEPAVELASYGDGPWGALGGLLDHDLDRDRDRDRDRGIVVTEGFLAELVYAVPRGQGSWVSLAADARGRLFASAQQGGLFRIEPAPAGGDNARTVVEPIDTPVGAAQGMASVDGDLYCVVNGSRAEGAGLYRLRDLDGDDRLETSTLLRSFEGGGEHGPHGVVAGPDGMLYVVAGNHTTLGTPERSAVPRRWGEDHLLPRLWDARGHAVGILAPGGWICRTDVDGRVWELLAIGFRNPYDLAFNPHGELFTYDADMEWDMGAPWYRPTRVNHVVSGAEFGWRSGSGKWPPHYPDSLPAVIDIGPGSPTGVVFGTGARFPARYRRALYLLDWTFGTIHALHLMPKGASYEAKAEEFLTGRPLPLADAVINPVDGAMYFVVGGRGVPSALYRVRYVGDADVVDDDDPSTAGLEERGLRRRLESLHRTDASADAVDVAWPMLGHPDRHVRAAARVALEHQPPERWPRGWMERVGTGFSSRTALAALLALTRVGALERQPAIVAALDRLRWGDLDRTDRLEWLRVWGLCFIRMGRPEEDLADRLGRDLAAVYPTGDDTIDRELCDLLVYLDSPIVVARTIPLLERADAVRTPPESPDRLARSDTYGSVILRMATTAPQRQQVHYALTLRHATRGWTPELRTRYFRWFDHARRTSGGLSFAGFLEQIREDALEHVPAHDRDRYAAIGRDEPDPDAFDQPRARGPGRVWTSDGVAALARDGLAYRDFEQGRRTYAAASCDQCHRFAGTGLAGGPDLTKAGTRYAIRDLAESIVEPSRIVSDQYRLTELQLRDDALVLGRVVEETPERVRVMPSLLVPEYVIDVPTERIVERRVSTVSPMMPGLLDALAADEVLDLLAYLLAEGDARSPLFEAGDETALSLFDGRTLEGWSGDRDLWSVEDGVIVGRTTADQPIPRNTFLAWAGPPVTDFVLRAEVRLSASNNSGIQYRSRVAGDGRVEGYQCDLHPRPAYDGMLYEEGGRGIVATHGQRLRIADDGTRTPIAEAQTPPAVRLDRWNRYTIIARGRRLEHRVNGHVAIVVDDAAATRVDAGAIALQLHAGAPYEVRFRNVRLWRLDRSEG